jgi:uncharacterized NAD(P)/FAD-binding protein YdhS
MFDFAIVGLGATGVSFLRQLHSQLYEQELKSITVAVISPPESFAVGLAFGKAESFLKVNTPPELMSIDPEDPHGFSAWMRRQPEVEERYPSRLKYSKYLKDIYHSLKEDRKLNLHEYHSSAIDIDDLNGYQKIRLGTGQRIKAHRTVLTLGSLSAPTFSPQLQPVYPDQISMIETPSRALVAGTGLTAVDCVRSLVSKGCPSIHMFSRNGFVPTAITTEVNYMPNYFT